MSPIEKRRAEDNEDDFKRLWWSSGTRETTKWGTSTGYDEDNDERDVLVIQQTVKKCWTSTVESQQDSFRFEWQKRGQKKMFKPVLLVIE